MLDKNKPFGEVFGFFRGAKYEQEGKYFTGTGEEITIGSKAEVVVPEARAGTISPERQKRGRKPRAK